MAGHNAEGGSVGARYRVVVGLAFSRKEHVLPPLGAEPAVIQVGVAEHEELFLPALREV